MHLVQFVHANMVMHVLAWPMSCTVSSGIGPMLTGPILLQIQTPVERAFNPYTPTSCQPHGAWEVLQGVCHLAGSFLMASHPLMHKGALLSVRVV